MLKIIKNWMAKSLNRKLMNTYREIDAMHPGTIRWNAPPNKIPTETTK